MKIVVTTILILVIVISLIIIKPFQQNSVNEQQTSTKQEQTEVNNEPETKKDENETENTSSGKYIDYDKSLLTSQKNVIFFAASWCPTCRALDSSIKKELSTIPSDLNILKADYDKEIELRKKYGVTYQHTLVQVDKDGNQIAKWNGSRDISEIVSMLK